MQENGNLEVLFPGFINSVIDVNDESDSKIAQVFDRTFKIIYELSKHYFVDEEELNEIKNSIDEFCIGELGSKPSLKAHSGKKLGINTLGNLLTINIQDISMRGGWALKSFNTFFDYWTGALPSSVRSGKMLAGWRTVRNIIFVNNFDWYIFLTLTLLLTNTNACYS